MIIGINGPKGSGKNTVAEILAKNHGFKTVGFADLLKKSAAALFDIKPEEWETIKNDTSARVTLRWRTYNVEEGFQKFNEKSVTGREFLQRYGTEAHREVFGYDVWVDALLGIGIDSAKIDNVAIYDARFDNELKAIREYGGKIIQVRRPGYAFNSEHESEKPPNPDLIDYVVDNHGTLKDLEWKLNALVRSEKLADRYQSGDSNNPDPLPLQQLALDF